MDKALEIHKIEYGRLDMYCALKFDSKLSFEEIYKRIAACSLAYNDNFIKRTDSAFTYASTEIIKNIKNHLPKEYIDRLHLSDSSSINIKPGEFLIEDEQSDKAIRYRLVNKGLEQLKERHNQSLNELKCASKFFGRVYSQLQKRVMLLPLEATLEDGAVTWIYVFLYIFANKTGVLRFELPLINSTTVPLLESNSNRFISHISNKLGIQYFLDMPADTPFSDLPHMYCAAIHECIPIELTEFIDTLTGVSLVKYDGMPSQIDAFTDDALIDLYRIIDAPAPLDTYPTYFDTVCNYLKAHQWGQGNIRYYIKSTGVCFSVVDSSAIAKMALKYKELMHIDQLSSEDYHAIYDKMAGELQVNTELAMLVILLEKANMTSDFYKKNDAFKDYKLVQKEYNVNRIFLSELQETCYGSVNDQILAFKNLMYHFLKPDIVQTKYDAINSIIIEKEQKRSASFQKFLSVAALCISVLFGLPAIKETLTILRSICTWLPSDVPYLTIDNASVFVWSITNITIAIRMFRNYFYKKGHSYLTL